MPANIEAFAAYHRQKESLTDYLQVASAGVALLQRTIVAPNAPALLGSLVDACGVKHWGIGKQYKNPAQKVELGRTALANQGIVQQVAAFDLFSRSVIQDVARFSVRARNERNKLQHDHELLKLSPANRWVSNHCCNDIVGQLATLSQRLDELSEWIGWAPSQQLVRVLPLFDFIRSVRNRITHGDGIVGAELEALVRSRRITEALRAFRDEYAEGDLPALPEFVRGKPLQLEVVHSILFGAFLYEIAKEVNAWAINLLTQDEIIDMAFYYSCVIEEHPFRTIRHRTAESRIKYFLIHRYLRGIDMPLGNAVIRRLRANELVAPRGANHNSSFWGVALERHIALSA
jgi:hypothetical protein